MKNNKSKKLLGLFISITVLLLLGLLMVAIYKPCYKIAKQNKSDTQFNQTYFIRDIGGFNYSLNWILAKENSDRVVTPDQVYLPDSSYQGYMVEELNSAVTGWYQSLKEYKNLEYMTYIGERVFTNTQSDLKQLFMSDDVENNLKDVYQFYIMCHFDEDGNLFVEAVPELTDYNKMILMDFSPAEAFQGLSENDIDPSEIQKPKNFTAIYAIPKDMLYQDWLYRQQYMQELDDFQGSGFVFLLMVGLAVVAFMALLLPAVKAFDIGNGISSKIPFEIALTVVLFLFGMLGGCVRLAFMVSQGNYMNVPLLGEFSGRAGLSVTYGLHVLMWAVMFGGFYVMFLSFRQVITIGPKRYLREKVWVIILWHRFVNWVKKSVTSLKQVDLTDPTNKWLFKILIVNFSILVVITCFWFFGIFGLIVYSILLFFFFKKYVDEIKEQYGKLLKATKQMAKGKLDITIDGDLGALNPLKEEIEEVQIGFKKAVDEEVKSQKMKTDLITNVSHDLKTPLTAIITYIDLLKNDQLSEEERRSYIETLEKKSHRLKTLIEDLFEISKVSSNSITLNKINVDLNELMKQVVLELQDKIQESGVVFKYRFPEEKVVLELDSEKTYRIFENLIINITKYALPGTRAYVEMERKEDQVVIEMKNVSAQELDFDIQEITERFVRGDKARNSEGSGLGLAIVKSFVEIQGGTFHIGVDGDLFKATIIF